MADKIYLDVTLKLILRADEGANLDEILGSLNVTSGSDEADVELAELQNYEIEDAK